MSERVNHDRRRFLSLAAMTAVAELVVTGSAGAQSNRQRSLNIPAIKRGTHTSLGALKQIDAGVLNVSYAEVGLPLALR
jgi:nitrous oxide reductase